MKKLILSMVSAVTLCGCIEKHHAPEPTEQEVVKTVQELPPTCEKVLRVIEACAGDYVRAAGEVSADAFKDANGTVREFANMRETLTKSMQDNGPEVATATCNVPPIQKANERSADGLYWFVTHHGSASAKCKAAYEAFNPVR
jgi:hypothetical protein